jgi:ATP-dependent RNA helicase DeaD
MTFTFEDLGLSKDITDAMEGMGWKEPTPVQEATVPEGLSGRDMFAQAQTGTGKTGAYASIVLGRTPSGSKFPSTLVLAPTRELANQVSGEIYKLSRYTGHRSVAIYGGASIDVQIKFLRRGSDVVVGTPGRVGDLMRRGELNLSNVSELVLDEADRMLDMGFEEEIDFILDRMSPKKQTLLFSATMSDDVRKIALSRMKDPLEILVSKDDPVSDLTEQYFVAVPRGGKQSALYRLLEQGDPGKTIIFCGTKNMVDMLTERLGTRHKVGSIHGDMPQSARERVMKNFRRGTFEMLVATDVAARGLDIDDVDLVVNYDMPMDPETYMHRIGRTGRAGRTGTAISLVTPNEMYRLDRAEDLMGKEIKRMDRPKGEGMPKKQAPVVKIITDRPVGCSDMTVVEIGLGKDGGMGKAAITAFVHENAGISPSDIGRVGLRGPASFVEISSDKADAAVEALSRCKGKDGKKLFVRIAPKKTKYKDKVKSGDIEE